jgi:uncharacterized protein (DUF1697 family)
MPNWVALFRGVNVGGKNKILMADLKRMFERLKCENVQTYIQSGNVVFSSKVKSKRVIAKRLLNATEEEFGFRSQPILLSAIEFKDADKSNPFSHVVGDPKSLHFFFLESKPASPDLDGIAEKAIDSERFKMIDSIFYLHAPQGMGRSKLAAVAERKLGVSVTARNYSTVERLLNILTERMS